MTDQTPHGCTIDGQPAMPIRVDEYNQLTARLAEAEARAEQAEDLLRVAHDTSNRSEAERARAVQRAERAEAAIARVRRLCDLTISASVRVHAVEQAHDTLAALDDAEQPAEHCGHLSPVTLLTTPRTECVLPPGHQGSHADNRGCRWWIDPSAAAATPAMCPHGCNTTHCPCLECDAQTSEELELVAAPAEPDTILDPAWLRKQYATAARTVPLRLGPNAVAMAQRGEPIILNLNEADALADAMMRVRDRHIQQLRQRLTLADEAHRP